MEKRIELERRARKANQITDLNLDNCRSTSIVGLTDEYTALESLSLINVGLTTLKGFPKLPNLKKLELSDNRISNGLNYLHTSPKLEYLNLSGNKIKDLEALKPLEEFKHLAFLDLFNNEATQIDNYRDKTFEILPSLRYLDGFDCNDVEALSVSDDEEENGNFSEDDDDKQKAFSLNGLEFDLDELEAFEKRLKAKREAAAQHENHLNPTQDNEQNLANASSTVNNKTPTEEIDELDEYLKTLKLKEEKESASLTTPIASNNPNLCFALLLYWFLAILNMASATFYSEAGDDGGDVSGDDDGDEEGDEEDDEDMSLSEIYNDDLEEDEDEWDEENAENNDDDDFDNDNSDEDEANNTVVAPNAVKAEGNAADAGAEDESQARGKKRKHEG